MQTNELVNVITEIVIEQLKDDIAKKQCPTPVDKLNDNKIPVGVSNRHVHLSDNDLIKLFGSDAQLTNFKDLSQPGQFASEQIVTLVGPKGVIEKVRVLGPTRSKTQVEISVSDCFKLGIKAPIRDSGDLEGSAMLNLVGPAGSATINEGCIIAARHIHMHPDDAKEFDVKDKDHVTVKASGPRGVEFHEVLVRVNKNYKLEMHIDIDEANAVCLRNNDYVEIKK
ncbi:MAG: phosphate propanoyltransferase [Firmicutes bacterium]|nr:phosphate propanoyltransferase [Bacillota bacterium]